MKDLRLTMGDWRLKLRIAVIGLLAVGIIMAVLKPALIRTAVAQTYKAWYAYAKLTAPAGDDLLIICDDPNGTPASYNIGLDELFAYRIPVTLTDGGLLLGNGTGAIQALGVAANGQIPIGDGTTDPVLAAITGTAEEIDVSNGAGSITLSLAHHVGTDISADLEEETHASEHAVSGDDTVFPADPGADRVLMWDDNPGQLVWYDISGFGPGDMLKATYDVGDDGGVDAVTTSDTVTTTWVLLTETQVGTDGVNTDGSLTYDAATGTLAATVFSGAGTSLTGVLLSGGANNVNDTHIDWGAGANQVDADDVPESATNFWAASDGLGGNDTVKDTMMDWGSGAGQVDLADIPGGISGAHVWDFGGATSLELPNAESTDATLTALGQVHIRGDEDRLSVHLGDGGEIAGEATMSFIKSLCVTIDPGTIYDSNSIYSLGKISSKEFPNGIIIDAWEVNCHLDPDVEMDMNLGYSVNPMDMADPTLIDVLDTTAGQSSEDTDANINGGAAVPANVYWMLYFDGDPEGTCTMLTVQIWYHAEED